MVSATARQAVDTLEIETRVLRPWQAVARGPGPMKMTIPAEQETGALETITAARIVGGVKVYGKGAATVRALAINSPEMAARATANAA